ncbi:hypothetical protein PYCCODRAFT_1443684 [Trametes coccinea BRFM310]|uniref:Integrase core domain-containing protein n=1 Tax=Trametes coccinea (strain BRFM310) TaxID=1353009 RepID=A0A1Y2IUW5_TRAC3|nr:hypothetical protein PYCCODRAFT_1443684 [Trametes coccinea BRFM310]
MEAARGLNRGSYIWGRSVHNTRIERLWYDVTQGFGSKWKNFLLDLEHHHGLDTDSAAHLWLRAASPRELFMFGMLQHGPRGIEHVLDAAGDDLVDGDTSDYGIDWDVIDDTALMAHHLSHNPSSTIDNPVHPFGQAVGPDRLAEVVCDPPGSPLTVAQAALLDTHLAHHCDLTTRNMQVRKLIWTVALHFCRQLF